MSEINSEGTIPAKPTLQPMYRVVTMARVMIIDLGMSRVGLMA